MDAQALGRYLRQTRETQELTLEDAEYVLKIRRGILESFELGEFTIPNASPVQIRGFIRNYARYLGLDEEKVIAYYDEALAGGGSARSSSSAFGVMRKKGKRDSQPAPAVNTPVAPRTITDTHPRLPNVPSGSANGISQGDRGTSPIVWILRALVAIAAVAIIVLVIIQLIPLDQLISGSPTEQANSDILAQLPPTASAAQVASPTLLFLPTATGAVSNYTGEGLLLELTITQRAWLQIAADNIQQFSGLTRPGEQMTIRALDNITLSSSNAEALEAIFNGQVQPVFGARGQRVDLVFSAGGVQISTGPGFAPTPVESVTPLPTPTDPAGALIAALTPSATIGPSPTPSNTFTPSNTPTDTLTPSATFTPSNTFTITSTPTDTPTDAPTATSTLPPTNTPVPSTTIVPSDTPLPTATQTPSATPTPTQTMTSSPTPNLPPRFTPANATPTKGA